MHDSYNLIRPEDVGRYVLPSYNIASTQDALYVANDQSERRLLEGRWWLVPFWAKEIPKWTLFNARSEDAYKKPAFPEAFKSRRCLIPPSGFFEWTKAADGGKDPHYIYLPDHQPFALAGLWSTNDKLEITSYTILTAAAVQEVGHLNHRMPIILDSEHYDQWLETNTVVDKARELLKHNRVGELISHRVGRAVNNSRASGAALIEALS